MSETYMELIIIAAIALGATAVWGVVVLIDFLRPVKKTARKLKKMMYMARSAWDELDDED
jgi:16S rRNA U1498 N3-methylase RsmE